LSGCPITALGARLPPDGAMTGELTRVDVELVDVAVRSCELDDGTTLRIEHLLIDEAGESLIEGQHLIQPIE
jgi:hypothetical protein